MHLVKKLPLRYNNINKYNDCRLIVIRFFQIPTLFISSSMQQKYLKSIWSNYYLIQ